MTNFKLYKTDDGSVGIYDLSANDIMHSKTGALKESFEKFIIPIKTIMSGRSSMSVLDLCSGVGYNLKALLYSELSDSISIDSVDTNINFLAISPFILDGINNIDLKLFIFSQLISNNIELSKIFDIIMSVYTKFSAEFFDPSMIDLIKNLFNKGYNCYGECQNNRFVHNIYYKYISNSMKYDFNDSKYNNIKIRYHIADARYNLLISNSRYDIIFLDGYTPQKDPSLWTYDFLKLLKSKMNENSVLVSYSKSTPFRSALVELGFYVGKTFINEIDMGTIASNNLNYIYNPLTDFDFKLIETTAGIPYRDEKLNAASNDIILHRSLEQKNSHRQSHTNFLKSLQ